MEENVELVTLVSHFIEAIGDDGKIDAEEAIEIWDDLAALLPADTVLSRAGDMLMDALYRDEEEMRTGVERIRQRAAKAAARGHTERAARRSRRARRLEHKADML